MSLKKINQGKGMVDVSSKAATKRQAVATGVITLGAKAFKILTAEGSPKGDVFQTAKIAGIMAAKNTPNIVPLCHPLEISKVALNFKNDKRRGAVHITAEVNYVGRTGVEMEALSAVSAAALTIYDMMKWADKGMTISEIQLQSKSGGKSGDYHRG